MQVMREVARHIREQHVIRHVGGRDDTDAGQQAAPVLGGDFFERYFGAMCQAFAVALFKFVHVLLEGRGFFQCMTQVQADHAQGQGEEERQTPAPGLEIGFTDYRRDQHNHTGAEHKACDGTEVQPTAEEPAFTVRRVFGDKDRGTGVFTAHRETLGHFAQQQQDRRPDANRRVTRNQADGEGAQGHDHDGGGEHFLPSVFIAQGAEEQAAQGANQEGHGEGAQGRDHLYAGRCVREEHLAEHIGDKAVDAEVEPLHGVAQCGGGDRLAHLGIVDNRDVF